MPTPGSNIAQISIDGQLYSSWESVIVERTYMEPMSYATFTCAEIGPTNSGFAGLKIGAGDAGSVLLNGQLAASGMVDIRQVIFDGTTHHVQIRVHSWIQDLLASTLKGAQYTNSTLEQIVGAVTQPLGIRVNIVGSPQGADKQFLRAEHHIGQSAFDFISDLAHTRNLFMVDDASGKTLNFWRGSTGGAGGAAFTLTEGQNILRARSLQQYDFAVPLIGVQGQNVGNDTTWPSNNIFASAKSPIPLTGSANQRTFTVPMPMAGDQQDAQMVANHEIALNQLKLFETVVTVPGWTAPDGQLWLTHLGPPPIQISLNSPMVYPTFQNQNNATLYLKSVRSMQSSNEGSTTELTLVTVWGLGGSGPLLGAPP